MPLADLQANVRGALLFGDVTSLQPVLAGGIDPEKRLSIHQRHYATSLVTALLDRFPATIWLVGSGLVTEAARDFVKQSPPSRPCIAEYGDAFPAFLGVYGVQNGIAYLQQFSKLEWHVGRVSLCVDAPPVGLTELSTLDPTLLSDATVTLQSGACYLHCNWALDELLSLYLTESAPSEFVLRPGDAWLELHGNRGQLRMTRLSQPEFTFRRAIAAGSSVGAAAVAALDIDEQFDAGQALVGMCTTGLVAAIHHGTLGAV
jgi:hypothetical protein